MTATMTPLLDEDLRLFNELEQTTFETVTAALVPPAPAAEPGTIEHRFAQFHEQNPWVYARLRVLALDAVEKGMRRVGMKMLWEVLRWHTARLAAKTGNADLPLLNNDYTARYARLLADHEPALAQVFETRALRAA